MVIFQLPTVADGERLALNLASNAFAVPGTPWHRNHNTPLAGTTSDHNKQAIFIPIAGVPSLFELDEDALNGDENFEVEDPILGEGHKSLISGPGA